MPVLIFKGKLHADFAQRFARYGKLAERSLLSGKDRIWIQAVSVGEVALCKNLVPLLKQMFPENDIVISTITKAGNDLARSRFSKDAIVIYFPLDFSFVVKKALDIIRPKLYIMIETEIWPNLLKELSARSVPSAMINGRISDRSINKYRMVKPFLKKVLGRINLFCMQDSIDAERITELGADRSRVIVTGNMKFDADISADSKPTAALRGSFGLKDGEDLLVAGSTHEGEEEAVAEVFKNLSYEFQNLRLLIAPRHVDRANNIKVTLQKYGLLGPKVRILDTIGRLNDAYSIATLVFIGGSLVKHGGQNPIEPAVFAKPILFGPHMFNFKYVTAVLLKNNAALQVADAADMYKKCARLLKDGSLRIAMGEKARKTVLENRGATKRNIEELSKVVRLSE